MSVRRVPHYKIKTEPDQSRPFSPWVVDATQTNIRKSRRKYLAPPNSKPRPELLPILDFLDRICSTEQYSKGVQTRTAYHKIRIKINTVNNYTHYLRQKLARVAIFVTPRERLHSSGRSTAPHPLLNNLCKRALHQITLIGQQQISFT